MLQRHVWRAQTAARTTETAASSSAAHTGLQPSPRVSSLFAPTWQRTVGVAATQPVETGAAAASTEVERLRVAVDVDEVLGRFLLALNKFCFDKYAMNYRVEDYHAYDFRKIWCCTQEEANHIVHEFFKSDYFNDGIPPIPGASESLSRLSQTCDLVVVTSRQHVIQDATLDWIDRHYPGLFKDVLFGNHFALKGVSRRKSEICHSIGARVLIDDNPGYARDCADAGINVLLYDWDDSYPWSKVPELNEHPLITKVTNWAEVESAVYALIPEAH